MRIASSLRAFWANRWSAPYASRRIPMALLVVFAASGAACAVGAVQLTAAANNSDGKSSQRAATQPAVLVTASQGDTTQAADVHISANTDAAQPGTTTQSTVTSTTSAGGSGQSNTSVTVNGQQIPVPDNGSFSKTMTDASGTTNVQVSSNASSNSSVNVQVNSTSTSSGGGQ